MTTFTTEAQFEQAFIEVLTNKGWEPEILKNKTEADLLQNWASILFENNRQRDRLNDVPLTATEIQQIIEQIKELKTPLKLNGLINGKTVAIKRDNPADTLHMGKEVSLKYTIVRKSPQDKAVTKLCNSQNLNAAALCVTIDEVMCCY